MIGLIGAIGVIAFAILTASMALASLDPSYLIWAVVGSAVVALVGMGLILGALNNDGLERVGRMLHTLERCIWIGATGFSLVLSILSLGLSALAWAQLNAQPAKDRIEFLASLFVALTLAVVFAMLTTSTMQPILTVKSHRLQVRAGIWNALAWVSSISALLVAVAMTFTASSSAALFPPALFLGVITSLVLFVPKRAQRLSSARQSILGAATDALETAIEARELADSAQQHRALAASLRRLVNELISDSFVGVFPFGTQQRADHELVTVIEFATSRLLGTQPPPAVTRFPKVFEPYDGATTADFITAIEQVLCEIRERLLDRAQPTTRADGTR